MSQKVKLYVTLVVSVELPDEVPVDAVDVAKAAEDNWWWVDGRYPFDAEMAMLAARNLAADAAERAVMAYTSGLSNTQWEKRPAGFGETPVSTSIPDPDNAARFRAERD